MKRWILILMTLLLVLTLAACGEDPQPDAQQPDAPVTEQQPEEEAPVDEDVPEEEAPVEEQTPAEVDLAEVREAILVGLVVENPLMLETSALENLYGISASEVKQSACFVTMAGTFPDEIIMVEAVDEAAVDSVVEKLMARLDEVMEQSKSYDPENYKAAQECKVRIRGLHVSLILSPRQAEMIEIYDSYVK